MMKLAVVSGVAWHVVAAANLLRTITKDYELLPDNGPLREYENGPCQEDLIEICELPYPTTYKGTFDARMCLWANRDHVSQECLRYLTKESPSIIEPCYDSILASCRDITPGDNRLHNCLQRQAQDSMLPECKIVLDRDIVWTAAAAAAKENNLYLTTERDYDASSYPGYLSILEENENDVKTEEIAEYVYIIKKHHQQTSAEVVNDGSQLTSQLLYVVAFQDIMSSFSVLPLVQHMHDFLVHINDELNILEGYLLQLLSSADFPSSEFAPVLNEEEWTSIDIEVDEETDDDDYSNDNDEAVPFEIDSISIDDTEGEDIIKDYVFEGKDDTESEIEEDKSNGNHFFQESERAASFNADDEDWRKAFKLFSVSAPIAAPLSSDSIMSAPKNVVQLMVKTTMAAKNSFLSTTTGSTFLRGSQTGNPMFLQSLRTMITSALQDPRQ